MQENQLILFDYDALEEPARVFVEQRTAEIRVLTQRSAQDIIEIGQKLIEVKEKLGHGNFGAWLETEFGWKRTTAWSFMRVAAKFSKFENLEHLAPSALYFLAAPSTPDEARKEAIQRAKEGEKISYSTAQDIVAGHKESKEPRLEPKQDNWIFACPECGQVFSHEVWHCAYCHHHWQLGQYDCPNCHHKQATEKEREVLKRLEREAPDLFAEMQSDEKSISQAKRELVKRQRDAMPKPELPEGKYRVIYADPPWQYDNAGFAQSAEAHYPTMGQEELCTLPVASLTHDQCVLFLWATSPLLPEALEVMAAWGFKYKASRVWVKDRAPGIGWFVKTRHEFLLIGVRGSGMHPTQKLDSVFESPVTQHSTKPQRIYEDIQNCYAGPYIELFARNEQKGWEGWGNEL